MRPMQSSTLATFAFIVGCQLLVAGAAGPAQSDHAKVAGIVAQVQRADYEDNREALQQLYDQLTPFLTKKDLAAPAGYWRGFAMWRRALNGFNDHVQPAELAKEMELALQDFEQASKVDPKFVDARIAAGSCMATLMYLNRKDQIKAKELLAQMVPLYAEIEKEAPDNPRMYWVVGASRWFIAAERGGGQQVAIDMYKKGLEAAHKEQAAARDPLQPTWGEPELLMNLAWSNLNKATPDLEAAEKYARESLKLVPYWHYLRDILVPQIEDAKKKRSSS